MQMSVMACMFVFVLLLCPIAAGALAADGHAFVGLSGNGTNLVLNPPAGGQVVVGGHVIQELVQRIGQLEADRDVQRQRLDQLERVCPVVGDTDTILVPQDVAKWSGGVLADNGKIFAIPYASAFVLVINTVHDTTQTIQVTNALSYAWRGGVFAAGKIYGIPSESSNVLIIDPATHATDRAAINGLPGTAKWYGGVLAPNGKIYGIPFASQHVLIIDPATNE